MTVTSRFSARRIARPPRRAVAAALLFASGLVDDAVREPSFVPARVAALRARLRRDKARLRALPWRDWRVDAQIDVRWTFANDLVAAFDARPTRWCRATATVAA